jgi:hypothetical protein
MIYKVLWIIIVQDRLFNVSPNEGFIIKAPIEYVSYAQAQNPMSLPSRPINDIKELVVEQGSYPSSVKTVEPNANDKTSSPNTVQSTESATTLVSEEKGPQKEELLPIEPPKQSLAPETLIQEVPMVQDSEVYYHYDPYDVPNVQPLFKGEMIQFLLILDSQGHF